MFNNKMITINNSFKSLCKKILDNPLHIILLVLFAFSITQSLINKINPLNGMLFFTFETVLILFPGYCISSFLDLNKFSKLSYIGISYIIGYAFNIVLYYFVYLFNLKNFYYIIVIFYLLLCLYILIKKKKTIYKELKSNKHETILCYIFIIVLLIMQQIVFSANNALPSIVPDNNYYSDLLYWIGDSIELGLNYPPKEFRFIDLSYSYHYFSSMQLSVIGELTHIPYIQIGLVFSYIQPIILLTFSALLFFKNYTKKTKYLAIILIALFFTTGNENFTYITYVSHLWKAPFGFDISIAFSMVSISFILKQLKNEKINYSYLFISTISYFVCLGSKGPVGTITIILIGIICLYQFFIKKQYKTYFIWGSIYLIIFFVLYFFVLNSKNVETYNAVNRVNFNFNSLESLWNSEGSALPYKDFVMNGVLPTTLSQIIYVIFFFLSCNFLYYIFFAISIILLIFKLKKIDAVDIACIITILASIICTTFMNSKGRSQLYFTIAAYPIILLFDAKVILAVKENISRQYNKYINAIIAVLLCQSINFFIVNPWLNEAVYNGFKNYYSRSNDMDKSTAVGYMDKDLYKAYEWIRENTEKDKYFLADNALAYSSYAKRASYIVGVATERHIWQNNLDWIAAIMNNDFSYLDLIKKEGVDYIIQTKWISPNFNLPNNLGKVIYENDEIRLFVLF